MSEIIRVSPQEANKRVSLGKALLVCAYDDDEKHNRMNLDGSISLNQLKDREESLSKDQEIIFYCA